MQTYIRTTSYQLSDGNWVPSLYVLKDCGEESLGQSYTWHDEMHTTQEAADTFALQTAKAVRVIE